MSIASNLRNELDRAGLSVTTVAAKIRAEPSSVRKYLSGKIRPSDRVLVRLARCLDTTPEILKYGRPRRTSGKLTTDEVADRKTLAGAAGGRGHEDDPEPVPGHVG